MSHQIIKGRKCKMTIFSKILSPIFAFWPVLIGFKMFFKIVLGKIDILLRGVRSKKILHGVQNQIGKKVTRII